MKWASPAEASRTQRTRVRHSQNPSLIAAHPGARTFQSAATSNVKEAGELPEIVERSGVAADWKGRAPAPVPVGVLRMHIAMFEVTAALRDRCRGAALL